jgi:hypothetical protein
MPYVSYCHPVPARLKEDTARMNDRNKHKVTGQMNHQTVKLADKYIEEKVVRKSSIEDCRHIAMATIYKVDVLASWNFKHIVNLDRIKGYNSVNLRLGYTMIEIRSPKDLVKYGDE